MLLPRDAALLAARLGRWSVVAVSTSTVVYSIPRHGQWVLMVHCITSKAETTVEFNWGHPYRGTLAGVTPVHLAWSSVLALDIWAAVTAFGGADSINPDAGEHRPRPVFFGHPTGYLLMLAARFVYWPHPVHTRLVGITWIITSRAGDARFTVRGGVLEHNDVVVAEITPQQSLGSAPQDPIFFAAVRALETDGRSLGAGDPP